MAPNPTFRKNIVSGGKQPKLHPWLARFSSISCVIVYCQVKCFISSTPSHPPEVHQTSALTSLEARRQYGTPGKVRLQWREIQLQEERNQPPANQWPIWASCLYESWPIPIMLTPMVIG
ncbi:hypothetical protein EmuJ_000495800 [Echinococcus multilocularis]|uniref:Uncharacterized protein n=1 Tax=Echinococcus multilocularis TaxID=6211 RepID=A0A068Y5Y1_ECHMU|nr:hypothetical protein EmuJ_000495800 [Echinococcus multilocularis]